MKPLLFSVLPRPPHPTRDGLAIRNFHLLEGLAARFRVRAFSLVDRARPYSGEAPEGVEMETVPQASRGRRRAAAALASLVSGGAYSARLYRSPRLESRIAALAAREKPRWVVAHSYHVAAGALSAARPLWIDFHNLDSEIWERTAGTASSAAVRFFAGLQAPRVRAIEGELARIAAGLSCVSGRDADALRALGARAVPLVVPNGVDLSRYAFRREPAADDTVLFVGDLSWPPNAEGVRWFAREVWPHVRRLRPSARMEVVGRFAPRDLSRLASADFVLAGEAPDTLAHWARAAVAVVPLLAGGGTRLKILEAAACGVPVVSTPVGAEGLELEAEREILVRADALGFATAVVGLLEDRRAAERQAAAARSRVEALYDWRRIGSALALALERSGEECP